MRLALLLERLGERAVHRGPDLLQLALGCRERLLALADRVFVLGRGGVGQLVLARRLPLRLVEFRRQPLLLLREQRVIVRGPLRLLLIRLHLLAQRALVRLVQLLQLRELLLGLLERVLLLLNLLLALQSLRPDLFAVFVREVVDALLELAGVGLQLLDLVRIVRAAHPQVLDDALQLAHLLFRLVVPGRVALLKLCDSRIEHHRLLRLFRFIKVDAAAAVGVFQALHVLFRDKRHDGPALQHDSQIGGVLYGLPWERLGRLARECHHSVAQALVRLRVTTRRDRPKGRAHSSLPWQGVGQEHEFVDLLLVFHERVLLERVQVVNDLARADDGGPCADSADQRGVIAVQYQALPRQVADDDELRQVGGEAAGHRPAHHEALCHGSDQHALVSDGLLNARLARVAILALRDTHEVRPKQSRRAIARQARDEFAIGNCALAIGTCHGGFCRYTHFWTQAQSFGPVQKTAPFDLHLFKS